MCFIIHILHPKIKTARKDIPCYKVFTKGKKYFRSLHQGFKYEPGETYYEDSMKSKEGNIIEIGLHSFSTLMRAKDCLCLEKVIVQCIIPKGAKYYYNPYWKEYVSDYLTIGKESIKDL